MSKSFLYIAVMLAVLVACSGPATYSSYQSTRKNAWGLKDTISFDFPVQDTLSRYNLYIMLRNNEDYPYSNIILITRTYFPDQTLITDTLEYEMTNSRGEFLGTGFGSEKENKLLYKENVRFRHTGEYRISIRQAMRERNIIQGIDPLPGITDVGLQIEKNEK